MRPSNLVDRVPFHDVCIHRRHPTRSQHAPQKRKDVGDFYGWPYSYDGAHVDARVSPQRPDWVAQAKLPDYALGAHIAPLGLASSVGATLPAAFAKGMFVGLHGSWNRKPHSG